MLLKDKFIFFLFFILGILLIYTLININSFMKSEVKCESGFAIINKCGCIPDENLAKLLKVNETTNIDVFHNITLNNNDT